MIVYYLFLEVGIRWLCVMIGNLLNLLGFLMMFVNIKGKWLKLLDN